MNSVASRGERLSPVVTGVEAERCLICELECLKCPANAAAGGKVPYSKVHKINLNEYSR